MALHRDILARLPEVVIGTLAGRLGGPAAVGAFQGGMRQRQMEDAAAQRQAALDAESQRRQEAQEARQATLDTERQQEAERQRVLNALSALSGFATQIGDTATEPSDAAQQILGRATALEQTLDLPSGRLAPFVPNMAPLISRGVRADARQLLADAETEAKKVDGARVDDDVVFQWTLATPRLRTYLTTQGHPEGQPFTPSQIREIAGSPTVTARPQPTPRIAPNVPLDRQLAAAEAAGDTALADEIERAMRRAAAAQRGPRDPLADELARLRVNEAQLKADRETRSASMPSDWRNAAERAIMSVPAIRRGSVREIVDRLWADGNQEELKEVIQQAAIESENVDTQRMVEGRRDALRAFAEIETTLKELHARGVKTGFVRGRAEDVAQWAGKTTDPALATLGTRLAEQLFEYRRAMTGVQFSFAEGQQYQRMFPNYRNELPLNLARLQGLRTGMEGRQRLFWEGKLGKSGAAMVGAIGTRGARDIEAVEVEPGVKVRRLGPRTP